MFKSFLMVKSITLNLITYYTTPEQVQKVFISNTQLDNRTMNGVLTDKGFINFSGKPCELLS